MDSGFHRNDGLMATEPIKELVMQLLTHNASVGHRRTLYYPFALSLPVLSLSKGRRVGCKQEYLY